jgi:hypothetical protein
MVRATVAVIPCPTCAAIVEIVSMGLAQVECAACKCAFAPAVAFLHQRGKGIGPIGDATAPFETPEAIARANDVAVQASQSIKRNRRIKGNG